MDFKDLKAEVTKKVLSVVGKYRAVVHVSILGENSLISESWEVNSQKPLRYEGENEDLEGYDQAVDLANILCVLQYHAAILLNEIICQSFESEMHENPDSEELPCVYLYGTNIVVGLIVDPYDFAYQEEILRAMKA